MREIAPGDDAPSGGRREANKADKRRRILSAARQLFTERGFDATTTSEIARAAGIGTGTLFLYVRSKEDLLVAVFLEDVGRAWDEAFASIKTDAPLLEQLTSAFCHMVSYHEKDPALSRAFLRELIFVSEEGGAAVSKFMKGFFTKLEALLVASHARGELADDVSAVQLASNLWALYYTLAQRRHTGNLPASELPGRLSEAFRLQLRGLTNSR